MTTEQATELIELLKTSNALGEYIAGFLLFLVIVVICHYAYKFFNMFF